MEISDALKRFRKEFGLSQKEVSDALGITPQSYQVYERAANPVMPSVRALKKIAIAFDVSMDYLSGLSDRPKLLAADQAFFDTMEAGVKALQNAWESVVKSRGCVQDNQPAQRETLRRANSSAD